MPAPTPDGTSSQRGAAPRATALVPATPAGEITTACIARAGTESCSPTIRGHGPAVGDLSVTRPARPPGPYPKGQTFHDYEHSSLHAAEARLILTRVLRGFTSEVTAGSIRGRVASPETALLSLHSATSRGLGLYVASVSEAGEAWLARRRTCDPDAGFAPA